VKKGLQFVLGAVVFVVVMYVLIFSVIDIVRVIFDTTVATPTTGSYHEPIMTTLAVVNGVLTAGAAVALLVSALVSARRFTSGSEVLVTVVIFVVLGLLSATSLVLPALHDNEIDVTTTGFTQAHYEFSQSWSVTLYNATSAPVTVCTGLQARCTPNSLAPQAFNLNGTTLRPGQALEFSLTQVAVYNLTISTPTPAMTRLDVLINATTSCDFTDGPGC
jgi:hypothetical protein